MNLSPAVFSQTELNVRELNLKHTKRKYHAVQYGLPSPMKLNLLLERRLILLNLLPEHKNLSTLPLNFCIRGMFPNAGKLLLAPVQLRCCCRQKALRYVRNNVSLNDFTSSILSLQYDRFAENNYNSSFNCPLTAFLASFVIYSNCIR